MGFLGFGDKNEKQICPEGTKIYRHQVHRPISG